MYSPLYRYFEIRNDEKYSNKKHTKEVIEIIESTDVLINHGNLKFGNKSDFPWIDITCLNTSDGNYGSDAVLSGDCNSIVIVTSKREVESEQLYIPLLKSIAAKLEWELILEEDEEGNENVLIYNPN